MDKKLHLQLNVKQPQLRTEQPTNTANTSFVPKNNFIKINGVSYMVDEGDFNLMMRLGAGTCGTVNQMEHTKSKTVMAIKEMISSNNIEDIKRINMDLEVLLKCNHEHIVKCYGYFIKGHRVWVAMELMTICLDKLLKKIDLPFPENICGKIAYACIESLDYLKVNHKIIHRDVKPSNILINLNGEIKLCDFGVSGHLVDSVARTRQGSIAYMSPERIQPLDPNKPSYDIRADVWSLGITLVQLATNSYPYPDCRGGFELIAKIIQNDPPSLPMTDRNFTDAFRHFINSCLQKEVEKRPKYKELKRSPFYKKYATEYVDVKNWFSNLYSTLEIV